MQEIIQLYAMVADDLLKLNAMAGNGPDPDFEATLESVRNSFERGGLLYNRVKTVTPRGNQVVQTRFSAYRVSTSITFGLLRLYQDSLPWINNSSSTHREQAVEIASSVHQEYIPWFLVMRDIPVVDKSNHHGFSVMIRRMADNSVLVIQEFRERLDEWSITQQFPRLRD